MIKNLNIKNRLVKLQAYFLWFNELIEWRSTPKSSQMDGITLFLNIVIHPFRRWTLGFSFYLTYLLLKLNSI